MHTASTLDWIVLVVYFLAMAAIGPFFAHKNRTTEGYFLGDRSFPGWLTGISMFATSISSVTFVAYPGDAYRTAWLRMLPNFTMPLAILIAVTVFIPFFRRTQITSAFEYLEGRFGPGTRVYAALAFIFGQVVRVSLILFLVSLLVERLTGLDKYVSVVIGGTVTSFYSILGGIRAVMWTDFIQAIVLWVGGLLCLVIILGSIGVGTLFSEAWADGKFIFGDPALDGKERIVLAEGAPNTEQGGELRFTVPEDLEARDDYFVRVTAPGAKPVHDDSNVNFAVGNPADAAFTLLEPSWGDYWRRGRTERIRWMPGETDGPVTITLLQDEKEVLTVAEMAENTGEYLWEVPADLPEGEKYRVTVSAPDMAGGAPAVSRTFFSITDALPPNSLIVTAPNGSDVWRPGTEQTIRWMSTNPEPAVKVELVKGRRIHPASTGFSLTEKTIWVMLLIGMTNWLAEYSSNQNVVQRYAASKSAKEARRASWICCIFSVPTWTLFMFLGTALYVYFKHHHSPEATAILHGIRGVKAEEILPLFVMRNLPQGLSGLVIAGVLAAAMSSLSASINSVSAVGVVDIYRRHIVPGRSDRHYVIVAKLIGLAMAFVMIGGASILMASETKTLQDAATHLAAITAGGLLGLYLLGFLTTIGDGRAVGIAIACTVSFTGWMAFSHAGWLPEAIASDIDNYWTGILGHTIMFAVGFGLGLLLPKRPRDLHNMTVWTQDDTPVE